MYRNILQQLKERMENKQNTYFGYLSIIILHNEPTLFQCYPPQNSVLTLR